MKIEEVTVGRILYSHKKGRGIVDKEFVARKIFVHKHTLYERFLQRVKKEVFHGGPENASYYNADRCGVAITGGENITVEDAGGKEQTLQWTLDTFLKMSNIWYQSRAKFFCVQKTSAGLNDCMYASLLFSVPRSQRSNFGAHI